jgi:hypothetical protein
MMPKNMRVVMTGLLLSIVSAFLAGPVEAEDDVARYLPEKDLAPMADPTFYRAKLYELESGVWVGLRNRLDYKTWYWQSKWPNDPMGTNGNGEDWYKWYQEGNMKVRRYLCQNSGDYLSFGVAVLPGSSLVLDADTQIVLFYKDGTLKSIELFTSDNFEETVLYSATVDPLVFVTYGTKYLRDGSIQFFIARFPDGTIGVKEPFGQLDFDYPIAFGIVRGGEIVVPIQFSEVIEDGVELSLLTTGN